MVAWSFAFEELALLFGTAPENDEVARAKVAAAVNMLMVDSFFILRTSCLSADLASCQVGGL
jgi:hypothetical protein